MTAPYELYIAGEDIPSGSRVVISATDGKAYCSGMVAGVLAGNAVANIREGFRIEARDGEIREDDA